MAFVECPRPQSTDAEPRPVGRTSPAVAGSQLACHLVLVGELDRDNAFLAVADRPSLDRQRPGVQAANRQNTGSIRPTACRPLGHR